MSDVAYAEDELMDEGLEPKPNALAREEAPDDFLRRLMELAETEGDLSPMIDNAQLAQIGNDVVEDYQRDKASREAWEKKVDAGLKAAAQEASGETKTYPFENASNINYPQLTIAALQFNARSYPAIVKGDEAVLVKVFGTPATVPPEVARVVEQVQAQQQPPQPGQPPQAQQIPPEQAQAAMQYVQEVEQAQQRHQAKLSRARRVKDYLNYQLFYEMKEWESDTDALLLQLPIVGCAFRKVYYDNGKHCSALVPALRLVVNMDAKSLETAPRVTEEVPEVYPYQIRAKQRSAAYRMVTLPTEGEDDEKARMLLEQHRLIDLDGDGVEEPYIVTVDEETREVLSIQANFSPQTIKIADGEDGPVVREIKPQRFYIKYEFFPHPEGKFYGIGFAHLLDQIGSVINTAINQLNDAANAAVAGGGFITGGLRLQGNGQTNVLRFRPGEYKVVSGTAQDVRQAIYERTIPQPSDITFKLLELMLGAAKDITATKDVLTGDAKGSNQAVGTTLALIEQGLQVFTAIYKRVYRSLKDEFNLLYECISKYATEETAQEYVELLDDPQADFMTDFDLKGMDIRPVSDPLSVTRMQKVAQGEALLQLTGRGLNDAEIYKRVLQALDVEDIEAIVPKPQPNPMAEAEAKKVESETVENLAGAKRDEAETLLTLAEADGRNIENQTNAALLQGGLPPMAGPPPNGMGFGGPQG